MLNGVLIADNENGREHNERRKSGRVSAKTSGVDSERVGSLIYIHIPFCASKCPYCSFNSFVMGGVEHKSYMEALRRQFVFEIERFALKAKSITSIYIGGGTPSLVDTMLYGLLFEDMRPFLSFDCEITVEANPKSATNAWLEGMRRLGVNRLSLGVQSFDAGKLKFLGRAHSGQDAKEAVMAAQECGYDNISIDLIYATHFDTEEFWQNELEQALSLGVQHLSAYSLTIEEGTPFEKRRVQAGSGEENYRMLVSECKKAGFEQYEVSNFGQLRSRHNTGYWEYKNYVGLGAGAVGFLSPNRFSPPKDVSDYRAHPTVRQIETISYEDATFERLFLGLRSTVGVYLGTLNEKQTRKLKHLTESEKVIVKDGKIFCNDFLIADEIAVYLSE